MVRPTRAEWGPSGKDLLAFISLNGYSLSPVSWSNGGQSGLHLDLSLRKTFSLVDKSRPIEVGRLLAEVLERFHSSSRAITSRCWNNARIKSSLSREAPFRERCLRVLSEMPHRSSLLCALLVELLLRTVWAGRALRG
jgi:hypothetical protein